MLPLSDKYTHQAVIQFPRLVQCSMCSQLQVVQRNLLIGGLRSNGGPRKRRSTIFFPIPLRMHCRTTSRFTPATSFLFLKSCDLRNGGCRTPRRISNFHKQCPFDVVASNRLGRLHSSQRGSLAYPVDPQETGWCLRGDDDFRRRYAEG